jgi:hypothetical protein
LIRQREKRPPKRVAFLFQVVEAEPVDNYIPCSGVPQSQRRSINQLKPGSLFRSVASCLVAVLLWLPSAAEAPVDRTGESRISQASGATLALPSVPIRLGKASGADARSQHARDISQWLVPLPENSATFLRADWRGTAPAGNGQVSADVLALTFPYYATAPPSLRG